MTDATLLAVENLRAGYGETQANGIVKDDELRILECWLADLSALGG